MRFSRIDSIIYQIGRRSTPFQLWGFWDFEAELAHETLCEATRRLVARVPELGCRRDPGHWRDRWVPIEHLDPGQSVRFEAVANRRAAEEASERVVQSVVDIDAGLGFGVYCYAYEGGARLVLLVHHCLVDGRGMVNLMQELASCYRDALLGAPWRAAVPNARDLGQILKRLKARHLLLLGVAVLLEQFCKGLRAAFGLGTIPFERDPHITGRLGRGRRLSLSVPAKRFAVLARQCRKHGATLNDLLLAAVLKAVRDHNDVAGQRPKRRSGVIFAADMRRRYGPGLGPFANLTTAHWVGVATAELDSAWLATAAVKRAVDRMKRLGLGLDGIGLVGLGLWLPELVVRYTIGLPVRLLIHAVLRSVGLTNIGEIPDDTGDFGSGLAARCSILAPVFPVRTLLLAATTYCGVLTLELGYDGRGLSDESATRLLSKLQANLDEAMRD